MFARFELVDFSLLFDIPYKYLDFYFNTLFNLIYLTSCKDNYHDILTGLNLTCLIGNYSAIHPYTLYHGDVV